MIQAYPDRASVLPGEDLVLHVSTDRARWRVHLFRWDGALQPMLRTAWLRGQQAPGRGADEDWGWPGYRIPIPEHWPSAVYIAWCETVDSPPPSLALSAAAALFVVRGQGRGQLLYKLPLSTWHAYNHSGGGCFYDHPPQSADPPGARLSYQRPGGGIGGPVWCAADYYDSTSPRQTFAHWDAPFLRWLARHGYQADVCTDLDLHAAPRLVDGYRLLVSAGHDEYWSEPVRRHTEAFVARGGHLAIFGANTCWWRIHVSGDQRSMLCHQGGPRGARDAWWRPAGAARPEDALTGVSYRHGGGWWDGPRAVPGYTVLEPRHWVFDGTGLQRGEQFGAGTIPPLVGYECDGAPLCAGAAGRGAASGGHAGRGWAAAAAGTPAGLGAEGWRLAEAARACGTPAGFVLLAAAPLGEGWQERPPREPVLARLPGACVHAACMGLYTQGGTVFTAGTTDWAQVLATGQDARVDRITRNVLDRLLLSG